MMKLSSLLACPQCSQLNEHFVGSVAIHVLDGDLKQPSLKRTSPERCRETRLLVSNVLHGVTCVSSAKVQAYIHMVFN